MALGDEINFDYDLPESLERKKYLFDAMDTLQRAYTFQGTGTAEVSLGHIDDDRIVIKLPPVMYVMEPKEDATLATLTNRYFGRIPSKALRIGDYEFLIKERSPVPEPKKGIIRRMLRR